MKKAILARKTINIISEDEFKRISNEETTNRKLYNNLGVEKNGYIYPIVNIDKQNMDPSNIGLFDYGPLAQYNHPISEKDLQEYSASNIIDFDKTDSLQSNIQTFAEQNKDTSAIVVDKDNIYTINISENDSDEFKLLKQAINAKQINLDDYRDRFDGGFSNNIRLLTGSNNITFGKLKTFCDAFDIEVSLKLSDKPNCKNPMNKEFKINL